MDRARKAFEHDAVEIAEIPKLLPNAPAQKSDPGLAAVLLPYARKVKQRVERDRAANLKIRQKISGHYLEIGKRLDVSRVQEEWVSRRRVADDLVAVRIEASERFNLIPNVHHSPVIVCVDSSETIRLIYGNEVACQIRWE